MWLYIPISLSSPGSAASISPSDESFQMLALSVTWRGKSRRWQLWRRAWRTEAYIPRLFGETWQRSQEDCSRDVATWLSRVFPVRTSAPPDTAPASTVSVPASFSRSSASLAWWDATTYFWRTFQVSLFEPTMTPFSGRWPRAGKMRNGSVSKRPTWAPPTGASAGSASRGEWMMPRVGETADQSSRTGYFEGLTNQAQKQWMTPVAQDDNKTPEAHLATKARMKGGPRRTITSLQVQVAALWPTARSEDAESSGAPCSRGTQDTLTAVTALWQTPASDSFRSQGGDRVAEMGLDQQARLQWATPTSRDEKDGACADADVPVNALLGRQAVRAFLPSHPDPPTAAPGLPSSSAGPTSPPRLRLNPRFVEWLMDFPTSWTIPWPIAPTACAPSATPSCPLRPPPPSPSCGDGCTETEAEA